MSVKAKILAASGLLYSTLVLAQTGPTAPLIPVTPDSGFLPPPEPGLTALHIVLIVGFVLVFFLVVALFVWLIVSMSRKEQAYRDMVRDMYNRGQNEGKSAMQGIVHGLEDELARLKQSMPQMSREVEEEITEAITHSAGHAQIMFIHMGGQRDGHPERLRTRDEVTARALKVTIGKNADDANIAIPWDTKVSRRHCEISFDTVAGVEQFYVFDLNSTNGVLVKKAGNETFARVAGKENLDDGDVLCLGNSKFRVVVTRPVLTCADPPPRFGPQVCEAAIGHTQRDLRPACPQDEDTGSPFVPGGTVDGVQFSVTSPVMVPGVSHIVSVWAHLATQRQQVVAMAREESGVAEIRITSEGPVEIARGTVLTVRLSVQDLTVDPPEKTILWRGEIGKAGFAATASKSIAQGTKPGTAIILINGVPIMRVFFLVEVARETHAALPLSTKERRYLYPFACYASEDRNAVLGRIQGMQKVVPSLDVFLDVAKLRSGEHWQDRLRQEIVTRDVMYLFWSEAASRSKWVDWEWRCALLERGIEFIDPCPLAPPTKVPPPKELADKLHFNDWVLAYMSWEAASGRQ